ncbi:MAG: hypothetical protein K8R87_14340 [Verrucomicrobia bacterium]|nr:hypothetical protein [Verrucomicrobiota bacterium]
MPMNTTPTIKVTEDGAAVGVATARLLLQHAINTEEQNQDGEQPDLIRKRALNELTGASIHVARKVPAEGDSEITTKPLDPDRVIRTNSAY